MLADDTPAPLTVRDVIVVGATGRYLSFSDRLIAAGDAKGTLRTFIASTGEPR
ncbi:hypothetical protein ACFW1M_02585 [Streptomyces inhibens]|uniref:hypothetical protein n=1 Tax=Streptomyces inhibens TaxID=2293571 RepID=UPI0036780D63